MTAISDTTTDLGLQPEKAFRLERHGFDFIPLRERTMTLKGAAFFWAGTQANLLPMTLGALGVTLGLSLWQAIIATVIGNLLFAFTAIACVAGPRAGVPTLTFARSAFGPRGNTPNVALTWLSLVSFEVINTILAALAVIAFLPIVGLGAPGLAGKIIIVLAIVALGAVVAIFGHGLMVWIQRIASVVLIISIALVFVTTAGGADWGDSSKIDPGQIIPILAIAIAANASNPISYLFNSPEWFRYLPRDVSPRRLSWTLFASGAGIAIVLGILGAILASQVDMSDPIGGPAKLMPTPIFVAFLIAAVLGTISNNVPTLYSSGLTLQALGLPIRRLTGTLIDAVVSSAVSVLVLVNGGFLGILNLFVALLIVWLGPFGATYVADAIARKWRWDPLDLHDRSKRGQYFGRAGWNVEGWIAMLCGIVVAVLTINSSLFVGPLSALLGGTDLSWLLPLPVSFLVYLALALRKLRSAPQELLAERALAHQDVEIESERDVLAREHLTGHAATESGVRS